MRTARHRSSCSKLTSRSDSMPVDFFDSRTLDTAAIFGHPFSQLGVFRYRSTLAPRLDHQIHVVQLPQNGAEPGGLAIFLTTDDAGDVIVAPGLPNPAPVHVGGVVSWNYVPGATGNVAYDLI